VILFFQYEWVKKIPVPRRGGGDPSIFAAAGYHAVPVPRRGGGDPHIDMPLNWQLACSPQGRG